MSQERIAIVGSRGWVPSYVVKDYVRDLPPDTVVVSGGASGPDTYAWVAAKEALLPEPVVIRPREDLIKRFGFRTAAFARNAYIAALCTRMVAFWDSRSNGTRNAMDAAVALGKPVQTCDTYGRLLPYPRLSKVESA